jgi:hypothetical protein
MAVWVGTSVVVCSGRVTWYTVEPTRVVEFSLYANSLFFLCLSEKYDNTALFCLIGTEKFRIIAN